MGLTSYPACSLLSHPITHPHTHTHTGGHARAVAGGGRAEVSPSTRKEARAKERRTKDALPPPFSPRHSTFTLATLAPGSSSSCAELLETVLDLNIKDTLRNHSQSLHFIRCYSPGRGLFTQILCRIDRTGPTFKNYT